MFIGLCFLVNRSTVPGREQDVDLLVQAVTDQQIPADQMMYLPRWQQAVCA